MIGHYYVKILFISAGQPVLNARGFIEFALVHSEFSSVVGVKEAVANEITRQ